MSAERCNGLRRRDFLNAGLALGLVGPINANAQPGFNRITLVLTGGPSQLDTWDMKPDAPSEIRGPYRPIRTNVPGIEISEIFPRMARHADKYAIVRGISHSAPATHEAGHEAMQTARLYDPSHVVLPDPTRESAPTPERYGLNPFGRNCFLARRLVETGTRFVTVNMFDTVFNRITWDIHGFKPFSPIGAYRDIVGPMFDMAYTSLICDLHDRGLLSNTLVVAIGEFGRTPKINPAGGRDHWPQCASALLAGGPIEGGQIIGASDKIASEPTLHPNLFALTRYPCHTGKEKANLCSTSSPSL